MNKIKEALKKINSYSTEIRNIKLPHGFLRYQIIKGRFNLIDLKLKPSKLRNKSKIKNKPKNIKSLSDLPLFRNFP